MGVVDIGQFGINNKYCTTIVWLDPSFSVVDIIQRMGRAMRVVDPSNEDDHVTVVWDAASDQPANGEETGPFSTALNKALEIILNYDTLMDAFPKMLDNVGEVMTPMFGVDAALDDAKKLAIINTVGEYMAKGGSASQITAAASEAYNARYQPSVKELSTATDYMQQLVELGPDRLQKSVFNSPACLAPRRIVLNEDAPAETFAPQNLARALRSGELLPYLDVEEREATVRDVLAGHAVVKRLVAEEMRSYQEELRKMADVETFSYDMILRGTVKDAERGLCPLGGSYASIVAKNYTLAAKGKLHNGEVHVLAVRAVSTAVAKIFGLPDTKRDTVQSFAKQLSHALLQPDARSQIMRLAASLLVKLRPDVFTGLAYLAGCTADDTFEEAA